jgi:ATP-dependent helicase/nuclease subunit A
MPRRFTPFPRLEGDQAAAADPVAHAALSASAGTGKTQVLTARVLRLLLQGVGPGAILCLTFTKAGAAEMANRIGDRLAAWVRLPDNRLSHELFALGEANDLPALQRARRLFARVLETPGGLRIQTIHAFAQTLLASFPAEAGISPGFQPIEGRAESELATRTLADLLTAAEHDPASTLGADIARLSMRLGEEDTVKYLMRCAHAPAITARDPAAAEPMLRVAVGLPEGDVEELIVERCADGQYDRSLFNRLIAANRAWGTATGDKIVTALTDWLARNANNRAQTLVGLEKGIIKGEGGPCTVKPKQLAADPAYHDLASRFEEWQSELLALRRAAELVAVQAAGLRAGAAFAAAYTAAKRAAGVADFDDLIRWTRTLFEREGMGEWVRYKLDRRTDHILVDEAQDSNRDQWEIVDALIGEYFSGASEAEQRWRTIFMVGDFKQAIYGFQGTDPAEFGRMRERVRLRAALLIEAEDQADSGGPRLAREFRDLSIDASFRSAPAILELVDAVIREVGHDQMGLDDRPNLHRAVHDRWPGQVDHWPAFEVGEVDDDADGEEGWISDADRAYATHLAGEVKALLDEAPLMSSTKRPLCAGDIMILVRSRKELTALLVARLFSAGVPVAGIDRLHLHKPLAVQDLVAAVRFAVQPLDDLNLAGLLVSPLMGWDQQMLYDLAQPRGERQPLWSALQDAGRDDPTAATTVAALADLLRMADFVTPARYLETILSGPLDGRRSLLARLGEAARDPIDELVAAALEFERTEIASLDRFLAWFEAGEIEVKRDASAPTNAVRVMTVHGAKGLEAPVVILADSTADPANMGRSRFIGLTLPDGPVPVVRPTADEMLEPFTTIAAEAKARDLEEHWRLLYVALTRAAERLIIAGKMPKKLADDSWHVRVGRALTGLGVEPDDRGRLIHRTNRAIGPASKPRAAPAIAPVAEPAWLRAEAPPEPRPVRPLAPSSLGEDRDAAPPPSPAQIPAARRGTLLHGLFERLPQTPSADRQTAALAWLTRSGIDDSLAREEMVHSVLEIIDDPRFEMLFGPTSLAEAPIAATLSDGKVISGTVDRLLVSADLIRVIDFKTGAPSPSASLQLAAYRDALAVIFPDHRIEAALLYTAIPKLVPLAG